MGLAVEEWGDQASWDAFLSSQRTGHYNQSWGWGELAEPLGGKNFRFVIVDGVTIKAAMSVAVNPIRRTGRSSMYISRGPVVDEPTPEIVGLLNSALTQLAREQRSLVTKLELYVPADDRRWPALLAEAGFAPLFPPSQPRSLWSIDLTPSEDELLAAMKPKWRYNIRLAAKKGVEITRGTEADIDDFYALYQETSKRDGFFIHEKSIYEHSFRNFWSVGQFELLMARLEGKPLAAVTVVHLGQTIWYAYGASSNLNRELMAPHALQWEAMKIGKERGAIVYDMRGVADVPSPDQEMAGVYRFKQGFGGHHVTLMDQYARGHVEPWFSLWKAYWKGRYMLTSFQRQRKGLPHRQWA